MRLAIISDTHFGDGDSVLVEKAAGGYAPGPGYAAFREAAGRGNEYLVLAGDIFDFAVSEYSEAYRAARCFFDAVKRDGIADIVLYIAGNHDADLWHIVQHQRHVIKRLEAGGKMPEAYAHSVPAILDDRSDSRYRDISLYGVKRNAPSDSPRPYGNLFLENITSPPTPFYFAFPNLYIATDRESVLVTHGQFLEAYWSFLGSAVPAIAPEAVAPASRPAPTPEEAEAMVDIERMTAMNYPLNQLSCTGVGQAGPVTRVARAVEKEAASRSFERSSRWLDMVIDLGSRSLVRNSILRCMAARILKAAKAKALRRMESRPPARYDDSFFERPSVRGRFYRYYAQCLREIGKVNAESSLGLPPPSRIIFGHTHQPIALDDDRLSVPDDPDRPTRKLTLHNTGGWLRTRGAFCGAEVFRYDTEGGFSSRSVSSPDGISFIAGDPATCR